MGRKTSSLTEVTLVADAAAGDAEMDAVVEAGAAIPVEEEAEAEAVVEAAGVSTVAVEEAEEVVEDEAEVAASWKRSSTSESFKFRSRPWLLHNRADFDIGLETRPRRMHRSPKLKTRLRKA